MVKNSKYNQALNLMSQAMILLQGDHQANDAKTYLSLAIGSLSRSAEKQAGQKETARKYFEELGKKKNEEWNKRIKEAMNLSKAPQPE